jgi:hypothetical protein
VKTANEATAKQHSSPKLQNGHGDQRSGIAGLFLQPRGMRKIRCPHCAVVNLEKFVTYPHCAGCGALLTKDAPARQNWTAWRRPLGPILWATVLCCAAAAAVGAAMMLRRPAVMGQMVIYGQTMRNVSVNGTLLLSLTMDSIGGSTRETSPLNNVTIRFDKSFLQDFTVTNIDPPAPAEMTSGNGHYFVFKELTRETQVNFTFKALHAGRYKLRTRVNADSQQPMDYVANIIVTPKKSAPKPKQ